MDTAATTQEPKKDRKSFFWSLFAFGVSIIALIRIGYILHSFYLETASLAAGTEIRPMGVTFHLGIAWTASILFGGICAIVGGFIALVQRRWWLVGFAVLTIVVTWMPMFLSNRGFDYVVEVRKLVLEP